MKLSVIVTIVDGGETLRRCLRSLVTQDAPPELEILVPWDDTVVAVPALEREFPGVTFMPLGRVPTSRDPRGAAGQHELFDRRRAAGLARATGDLVAILEDRGVPRRDWTRTMATLSETLPHAAIGGAIENGRDRILNWAVFFCDFNRYQPPFDAGPREYVSDINICYRRRALDLTAELWKFRYHETTVHWALRRAGETLFLSPVPIVDQMRDDLTLGRLLVERLAWGRLFAYTRAREVGVGRRAVLAVGTVALPLVLLIRHARIQAEKKRTWGRFVAASPAVFLLLAAWCAGELIGYVTGTP